MSNYKYPKVKGARKPYVKIETSNNEVYYERVDWYENNKGNFDLRSWAEERFHVKPISATYINNKPKECYYA
jgi:hypothetical protein